MRAPRKTGQESQPLPGGCATLQLVSLYSVYQADKLSFGPRAACLACAINPPAQMAGSLSWRPFRMKCVYRNSRAWLPVLVLWGSDDGDTITTSSEARTRFKGFWRRPMCARIGWEPYMACDDPEF